jgi:rare lipoprotein A
MRKLGVGAVCLALALAGALGPSTAPAAEARDAPRARAEAQRPDRGGARAALGSGRAGSVARRPPARVQRGKASYYGREFHGRRMANGRRFDAGSRSAAHRTLPLGTRARVTNLENGRTETVTIEDRGPHVRGRILDVGPRTAEELGMRERGVAPVEVVPTEAPRTGGEAGAAATGGGGSGRRR